MLLFRAFRGGSLEPRMWRWAFSSLLVLVLIAAFDEVHQSLVPERTGSVIDVVIDAVGGVLALSVSVFWFHRQHGRKLIT
jgi:VanZ family protein